MNIIATNLKALNKKAETIFYKLIEKINEDGYVKIDNTNGAFMPVSVEKINESHYGKIYSIAHYYEQNGDLMKDPEMTFLVNNEDKKVYPISYQTDGIFGGYEQGATFENDLLVGIRKQFNNAHKNFANQWMININNQQEL